MGPTEIKDAGFQLKRDLLHKRRGKLKSNEKIPRLLAFD